MMIEVMANLGDYTCKIKVETINLTDMLDNIGFELMHKKDKAEELIGLIKQFELIIEDFCKKNKIKIEEE